MMHTVELVQFDSDITLAKHVATLWITRTQTKLNRRGAGTPWTVALSGGRIAKTFFSAVTSAVPQPGHQPWLASTHFFWADERCVPPDHPESNYAIANQLLLNPLQVAPTHVHRIRGELPPAEAAAGADRELRNLLPTPPAELPTLDLVILGMGEDGHVASLFPGDEGESSSPDAPSFRPVVASKPPPHRITLTYRMLQQAREIWVLASGAGKQEALQQSLLSTHTPLGRVRTSRPAIRIFTDIRS